ncbi:TQO small subunit DoxD [Streptacidiphilus anmyonensis]|uniref:TQO small subunit DoxD n=1 Tax=Streptacidiphilus anmyonensis TaxID=405782 RepID=UPI001F42798E|nr:TQO small subunit DoxD [Streptacidiphilus anmyonensis]
MNTTTASFRVRFTAPEASLIDVNLLGIDLGRRESMLVGAGAVGLGAATPRRRGRVTPITWTGQLDLVVPGVTPGVQPGVLVRSAAPAVPAVPAVPAQTAARRAEELEATQPLSLAELDAYDAELDDVRIFEPAARRPPLPRAGEGGGASQHQTWQSNRRVDLGLVLLPLRVLLGLFSIYAGFSKLCDPVYFNGGARGSMVHWLEALHPWSVAQPLMALALAHPVGAGLAVAFVQINVGVLAVLGLWQRFTAGVAMTLSFALLVTVSWRTVPVYDTPEIIYLAAWSPLLLAGAPMFSLDGWLHLEAWRRLGEQARVAQLRRRVMRRGVVLTTVVVGATLVLGSALGAAVRASHMTQTTTTTTEAPSLAPSPSSAPTEVLPMGAWPTGEVPVPVATAPKAGTGASAAGAGAKPSSPSPSASKHHKGGVGGTTTGRTGTTGTGTGTGAGTGAGGTGGGTTPTHAHNPAPKPTATGGNGVIGGLLGGG